MSYQSTIYKVFIASPSDVRDERRSIREMIYKWNNIHSEKTGISLQPVGWETHAAPGMEAPAQDIINTTLLDNCDILVGVLWSKLGIPTEKAVSGTVEEIDRHIESHKLTMIYFLEKDLPYDLDTQQKDSLLEYKAKLKKTGLITCIRNDEDISVKFYDHLCLKMNELSKTDSHGTIKSNSIKVEYEIALNLSEQARELLIVASQDTDGLVYRMVTNQGPMIQTNNRNFITSRVPREIAIWEGALDTLEYNGLVKADGNMREVFSLTNMGFVVADEIEKMNEINKWK